MEEILVAFKRKKLFETSKLFSHLFYKVRVLISSEKMMKIFCVANKAIRWQVIIVTKLKTKNYIYFTAIWEVSHLGTIIYKS